jgi:PAS domain S-box-containing protein
MVKGAIQPQRSAKEKPNRRARLRACVACGGFATLSPAHEEHRPGRNEIRLIVQKIPHFLFSIRARLMALVFVAMAPLLTLIVIGVRRQNERERALRLEEARDNAREIALRIDGEVGHLDGLLVSLSRAVSTDPADIARNEALLAAVAADLGPHVQSVNAHAADGGPLGYSTRHRGQISEGLAFVADTMAHAGLTVGEPRVSATTGKWVLTLGRPLPGGDGKPVGFVGVTLDLVGLESLLTGGDWSHLPEWAVDPVVSVINSKHIIVARSLDPKENVGKPVLFRYPVVEDMLAAREGAGEFTNLEGQRRLGGYSMCRRVPWLVYARVSSDAAFAQARAKLRDAVLWSGGSLALALGLAWLVSARITRPIRQLSADAAALGAGERRQLTTVTARGEVGVMARAFDQMLTNLDARDAELRRVNESLQHRVAELQTLFDLLPVGIGIATDASGRDIRMNRALAEILRLSPERNASLTAPSGEAPSTYRVLKDGRELRPDELPIQRAIAENAPVTDFEHTIVHDDGTEVDVLLNAVPLRDADGKVSGCVATLQDLTARKQAERQRLNFDRKLQETQKLESLGVMAGGIAHDFNNLLTGILGNASLAGMELPAGSPAQGNLESIKQGTLRAADLCKQMLAYSGRGRFVVQRLDLNRLIEETTHLLQISISKRAVLRFNLYSSLPPIDADGTQIRQVIMNLVINASEAIGEKSGVISLNTGVTRVDRDYLGGTLLAPELPEGNYVYLEVSDTGCGMSAETQAKIFEPFFTTKFTGRGLGLAAVLGIVRGHKGALKLYSEPGRGTTFKLLFPAAAEGAAPGAAEGAEKPQWRGQGCVLIADDEESVRSTIALMLRKLGFEPALTADGREAVDAFRAAPDRYALVLMDLTMPHLDGEQAFTELRRIRPDVRVVLMSGFNRHEAVSRFTGKGLASFLQKPFQFDELSAVLQSVLPAAPPK